MNPPEEMLVDVFLPAMRQLVARDLSSGGFGQTRISAMLGVTQASVSHYLAASREKAYRSLSLFSLSREEADRYAALLAEDVRRSPVYGVETLGTIWRSLLGRGMACDYHRRLAPPLSECDVCLRAYGGAAGGRSEALELMKEAVDLVEGASSFVSAMPEVSVNIAYLPGDSMEERDVLAVPGRIVKVKGMAKAILTPEFGASGHMARVLVLVRARISNVRAVINLRYDGKMDRALKRLRLRRLVVGGYPHSGKGDPTVNAMAAAMAGGERGFDVIIDRGGEGTEPNVYLFGRGPLEVARLAVKLSKLCSA